MLLIRISQKRFSNERINDVTSGHIKITIFPLFYNSTVYIYTKRIPHPKIFSSIGKSWNMLCLTDFRLGKFTIYRICTYVRDENISIEKEFMQTIWNDLQDSQKIEIIWLQKIFLIIFFFYSHECWRYTCDFSKMLGHKDVNFVELCDIFRKVKSSEMYFCVGMKHELNELCFFFGLCLNTTS